MVRSPFLGAAAGLLALVLLPGCDEKKETAPAAPELGDQARQAAEARLRSGARDGAAVRFRAMQTYAQALPRSVAVCGHVNLTGGSDEPFIPFVSVVSFDAEAEAPPRVDQHLANSSQEATRVYVELVSRCFEGGGPQSNRQMAPAPLPPLPTGLPRFGEPAAGNAPAAPVAETQAPAAPTPAEAATARPGPEGVAMRQNGNLHSGPVGASPVLRVVPRGTPVRVYAQAPGGWYQIGSATEAWGWMHGSLLDGAP
ncbi:SH3 domain-containing protein [Roseomonas sp. BN140053]|uniref:SH3 domain-containing protein n=1 Tax=Roseomonas sp. BN140053 TaxID=3391898 RepID=UPI0039ED066C